jgi:hypothetical protein
LCLEHEKYGQFASLLEGGVKNDRDEQNVAICRRASENALILEPDFRNSGAFSKENKGGIVFVWEKTHAGVKIAPFSPRC